jgi:hypothetical protein
MMARCLFVVFLGSLFCGCGDPAFLYEVPKARTLAGSQEEFVVREIVRAQADILWVIDNSGSMGKFQRKVIDNTSRFIQQFTQNAQYADWRIGLISTDSSQDPFLGFTPNDRLDMNTTDPVSKFQDAVDRLGIDGSGVETTYDSVLDALDAYPDFIRPGAILALIVVTDAEEQSRMAADEFLRRVHSKVGDPSRLIVYTVLGDGSSGCATDEFFHYPRSRYEEFVNKSRAKLYSLCSDFGVSLADIGRDIGRRMEAARLDLKQFPVINSIRVFYKDQELKGGPASQGGYWTYHLKQNAIVFHDLRFATGDFEKVRVTYEKAPRRER